MKRILYSLCIALFVPFFYLLTGIKVIHFFDNERLTQLPSFVQSLIIWPFMPAFVWFMAFGDLGFLPAIAFLLCIIIGIFLVSYQLLKKYAPSR